MNVTGMQPSSNESIMDFRSKPKPGGSRQNMDERLYKYLVAHWGDINNIVEKYNGGQISLPFPKSTCELLNIDGDFLLQ